MKSKNAGRYIGIFPGLLFDFSKQVLAPAVGVAGIALFQSWLRTGDLKHEEHYADRVLWTMFAFAAIAYCSYHVPKEWEKACKEPEYFSLNFEQPTNGYTLFCTDFFGGLREGIGNPFAAMVEIRRSHQQFGVTHA